MPRVQPQKSSSWQLEAKRGNKSVLPQKVCDENLCKIQLMFWLQWGDLLWITFRGNIEAARESENICLFCQTDIRRQGYLIILPRDGDDHLKHR